MSQFLIELPLPNRFLDEVSLGQGSGSPGPDCQPRWLLAGPYPIWICPEYMVRTFGAEKDKRRMSSRFLAETMGNQDFCLM